MVKIKRHPFRGLLGGLLTGVGLAVLIIVYGKAPFDVLTPWIAIGCGLAAGLIIGLAGPLRTKPAPDHVAEPPAQPPVEAPTAPTAPTSPPDEPTTEVVSTPPADESTAEPTT